MNLMKAMVASGNKKQLSSYSILGHVSGLDEITNVVVRFDINTIGVPTGTQLYWTVHGSITAADFTNGLMSGSFTVMNNYGVFTKTISTDNLTEGAESFYINLRTDSVNGPVVASSNTVNVSDNSITPVNFATLTPGTAYFDSYWRDWLTGYSITNQIYANGYASSAFGSISNPTFASLSNVTIKTLAQGSPEYGEDIDFTIAVVSGIPSPTNQLYVKVNGELKLPLTRNPVNDIASGPNAGYFYFGDGTYGLLGFTDSVPVQIELNWSPF